MKDKMKDRNTLYPIVANNLFSIYEKQLEVIWTPFQIDYTQDIHHLDKMTPEERHLILQILAFFAQSDSIVNENLAFRFMKDVNIPEALQFYSLQIGIEAIHADTYGRLIDNLVTNIEEKNKLFNAIKNFPSIQKKTNWMKKWILSQDSFSKRLLAFALVEGVFFAGSFCTIFYIRDRGLMPGLSHANVEIARDEGLHFMFASILYKELLKMDKKIKQNNFIINTQIENLDNYQIGLMMKENFYLKKSMLSDNQEFKSLTEEEVRTIVMEAVEIEKDFVFESLKVDLLGINKELLSEYISFCGDMIAQEFGFNPIYKAKQPFDFMVKNDIRGKVNFFEKRSGEYTTIKRENVDFSKISEDF